MKRRKPLHKEFLVLYIILSKILLVCYVPFHVSCIYVNNWVWSVNNPRLMNSRGHLFGVFISCLPSFPLTKSNLLSHCGWSWWARNSKILASTTRARRAWQNLVLLSCDKVRVQTKGLNMACQILSLRTLNFSKQNKDWKNTWQLFITELQQNPDYFCYESAAPFPTFYISRHCVFCPFLSSILWAHEILHLN